MESEFAAADIQSSSNLPPGPPLHSFGWTGACEGEAEAVGAQAPLGWNQNLHSQQLHDQRMQHQVVQGPVWAAPIDPASSLPIPAHWGADSSSAFFADARGELFAAPSFAATWPILEQGHPGVPQPLQLLPHWDPEPAAELQAAGPWRSSCPATQQQAYMLGAAADSTAVPPAPCAPHLRLAADPHLALLPYPPQLQGPFTGSSAAHQQPCGLPAPAFAISPPAPPPPARQGRLVARRKKAALPAEPSFGCDSDNLEGGASAVLLLSAEASQAPDELPVAAAVDEAQALGPPRSRAASLDASAAASAAKGARAPAAQPAQPSIEFDRAPRAVEWRPYSLSEYRQRQYDAKQGPDKYWELGSLGPAQPSSEGVGKRERRRQFGQAVRREVGGLGVGSGQRATADSHRNALFKWTV